MSCYHPLKGFRVGYTENGKDKYKIVDYAADHVELIHGKWQAVSSPLRSMAAESIVREFVEIPCGKCLDCRLRRAREWANRCMMELEYHDSAYFVTLTYDEDHLPRSGYVDQSTGEYIASATLRKKDLQDFFKRLRKRYPDNPIRYLACGEYGPKTQRPHYHAIIFGLHLDDLEIISQQRGYTYYSSVGLSKVWSDFDPVRQIFIPRGHIAVGSVNWQTCAYTARYILDKQIADNGQDYYAAFGLEPPFQLMSLKPAIGYQYYIDHGEEIYRYDCLYLTTENGGIQAKPPKYFDRLYDLDFHDKMQDIKAVRLASAQMRRETLLKQTDLSYSELLQVMETNKASRLKKLHRDL